MGESFHVTAPGRICLFGEHSDYLGLDVIAASINMAIDIECTLREDNRVNITYSDLKESDSFTLDSDIEYRNKRDYVRSAFNIMKRKGIVPHQGADINVSGNIPIAAGLSSSSALTVGSVMTVANMSGKKMKPKEVAQMAFDAEVVEFGESGGFQDHYASTFGGVIHIDVKEESITRLPAELGSIVIGDSGEKKKDTVGDIRYIKTTVEQEYDSIKQSIRSFDRRNTPVNSVFELGRSKPTKERTMAEATLRNRDLTKRALEVLTSKKPDHGEIGNILREHHEILRDALRRSTPKIERLIEAAYSAGALGCKINGSGGGGTMMAYCGGNEAEIVSAINEADGKAYIVKIGTGATINLA